MHHCTVGVMETLNIEPEAPVRTFVANVNYLDSQDFTKHNLIRVRLVEFKDQPLVGPVYFVYIHTRLFRGSEDIIFPFRELHPLFLQDSAWDTFTQKQFCQENGFTLVHLQFYCKSSRMALLQHFFLDGLDGATHFTLAQVAADGLNIECLSTFAHHVGSLMFTRLPLLYVNVFEKMIVIGFTVNSGKEDVHSLLSNGTYLSWCLFQSIQNQVARDDDVSWVEYANDGCVYALVAHPWNAFYTVMVTEVIGHRVCRPWKSICWPSQLSIPTSVNVTALCVSSSQTRMFVTDEKTWTEQIQGLHDTAYLLQQRQRIQQVPNPELFYAYFDAHENLIALSYKSFPCVNACSVHVTVLASARHL